MDINSSYFNTEKGSRQDDPIAAYLFILCVEMLGHKIRTDVKVKGITLVGNSEFKLCQFADDTVISLFGRALSLNATLDNIQNVSLSSGLRINKEKTKVFKIGQTQRNQMELLTRH